MAKIKILLASPERIEGMCKMGWALKSNEKGTIVATTRLKPNIINDLVETAIKTVGGGSLVQTWHNSAGLFAEIDVGVPASEHKSVRSVTDNGHDNYLAQTKFDGEGIGENDKGVLITLTATTDEKTLAAVNRVATALGMYSEWLIKDFREMDPNGVHIYNGLVTQLFPKVDNDGDFDEFEIGGIIFWVTGGIPSTILHRMMQDRGWTVIGDLYHEDVMKRKP